MKASGGSELTMETAFVNHDKGQAVCAWNGPDKKSIEDLFEKAGVKAESIDAVEIMK